MVAFLASRLPEEPGAVLDVACGAGRHVDGFLAGGYTVFGLDRSRVLLDQAPRSVRTRLVRGDMRRLPFPSGAFGAALSLFTSFGYFEDVETHIALLTGIVRVLRPNGTFVLDYANAPRVRAGLVPRSERMVDGHRVVEERRLVPGMAGERMVKTVVISAPNGSEVERYDESVALYDPETVQEMVRAAGFGIRELAGDYDGEAWHPGAERLVVIAGKTA